MKPILITIALILAFAAAKAQTTDTSRIVKTDTAKQWIPVDVEPVPAGGFAGFYGYIQKNLKYPKVAKEYNTQGKVRVEFVVEKDGSLSNIKVIESLTPETDAEAIRLIQNCPKWTPGMARGVPVRVRYSVPVKFELP
jgi:periplasmic protein TonB